MGLGNVAFMEYVKVEVIFLHMSLQYLLFLHMISISIYIIGPECTLGAVLAAELTVEVRIGICISNSMIFIIY